MATWVRPFSASHAASSSRPAVVVANVGTSRATLPVVARRTAATTVALWTSRPAQRGWRTSMAPSSRRAAGAGPPSGKSGKRAPGRHAGRGTSGGARGVPGPTKKRARAHQGEGRPRCRRRRATLPRFHPGGSDDLRWATKKNDRRSPAVVTKVRSGRHLHARIGTVRNSVYGRAVERQPARVFVKRSPKRTANWALAIAHAPGGILHSLSARFKTRNRSFRAASSVGKWPLALTARRSLELSASMAFVV